MQLPPDNDTTHQEMKFHNRNELVFILLQVNYALCILKKEMGSRHHDVQDCNVLVTHTNDIEYTYSISDHIFIISTHNTHVTIIDYE